MQPHDNIYGDALQRLGMALKGGTRLTRNRWTPTLTSAISEMIIAANRAVKLHRLPPGLTTPCAQGQPRAQ
jgi:hypothetical protein